MDKFIIDFYTKENGEQPAKDFILGLEPKMQAKIILTNGFVKKTQKTPRREIDLARKYRSDYERGFQNE